jgi:threonine/homoserine/homoserine lactone efflux protein
MPIDLPLFQLYLAAALILVLLPGPDSLLILSRGLFQGRRAGWIATAGTTTGNIVHASLAAAGVSALIAASPTFFDALRLAGAGYLAWLGVQALRSAGRAWRAKRPASVPALAPATIRMTFIHALLTNLLNPKVVLFYLSFVPQFVSPAQGSVALQTFLFGIVLALLALPYHLALAGLAAGVARHALARKEVRAAIDALAGLLFIGFAIRLLVTERRIA